MKIKLMLAFAICGCSLVGTAQKISQSDVPPAVQNSFVKRYPATSPKWEKEKGNYEAGFKNQGKIMSATFLSDGTFLESETSMEQSGLPKIAKTYLSTHYKGKTIKEYAKITNAAGVLSFEAEVNGMDLLFDSTGKFIKAVKD